MKRRRLWLWLLLLVPVALGIARLRLDVEVLNLLPAESPVVRGLGLYQKHFSNGRELWITLKATDADLAEHAARQIASGLRAASNLTSRVTWQAPWLEHPGQGAELVAYLWLNQPPERFAELAARLREPRLSLTLAETRDRLATSLSPEEIARRSYDPLNLMQLPAEASEEILAAGSGQEFFASPDGTFRILFVEASRDLGNYRDARQWLKDIQAAVQQILTREELGVAVNYTGRPAFVSEIATGMEQDMTRSVVGIMGIIAVLFWWAHRRFRPLLWLLALLVAILACTTAAGGLIFGSLNVVSLGFAAILLGLAADYGMVLYQEARATPQIPLRDIRRAVAPSILWASVTTAGAFFTLNLGGLPGLSQLGTLVALGILIAAVIMLAAYLKPLENLRTPRWSFGENKAAPPRESISWRSFNLPKVAWILSLVVLAAAAANFWNNPPRFNHSPESLRPRNSPAYATVEQIKSELGRIQEPLWILVSGENETQVAQRLQSAKAALQTAVADGLIHSFTLPDQLWPNPDHQAANRTAATAAIGNHHSVRETVLRSGFTDPSLALTERFLNTLERAVETEGVFWPTNEASAWTLEKFAARTGQEQVALGLVYSAHEKINGMDRAAVEDRARQFIANWPEALKSQNIMLSGWTVLGSELFDRVQGNFPRVIGPMLLLVLIALSLAFRRATEVALSFVTLIFCGLLLCAVMHFAGWSWNLMNMMAMPLLLGAAVDYTIHIQLALKRHNGNLGEVRRTIGRALLLCGGSTVAGFGSLAWSNNAGMASLGQVCATGIAISMLVSVFLLPLWWTRLTRQRETRADVLEK